MTPDDWSCFNKPSQYKTCSDSPRNKKSLLLLCHIEDSHVCHFLWLAPRQWLLIDVSPKVMCVMGWGRDKKIIWLSFPTGYLQHHCAFSCIPLLWTGPLFAGEAMLDRFQQISALTRGLDIRSQLCSEGQQSCLASGLCRHHTGPVSQSLPHDNPQALLLSYYSGNQGTQ